MKPKLKLDASKLPRPWRAAFLEGESDVDVRSMLDAALRADVGESYMGIDSVFPDTNTAVYAVAEQGQDGAVTWKLYQCTYEITDGTVALGSERVEVVPTTMYTPVGLEGCGCPDKAKRQRLEALIRNKKIPYSEADIPTLLTSLTDEYITILEKATAAPATTTVVIAPKAAKKHEPAEPTEAEFLEKFPHIAAIVEQEHARSAARKAELISGLRESKQDAYTEAELQALSIQELEKLHKLAKITSLSAPPPAPKIDTTLRGLPKVENEGNEDDKEVPQPPSLKGRVLEMRKVKAS